MKNNFVPQISMDKVTVYGCEINTVIHKVFTGFCCDVEVEVGKTENIEGDNGRFYISLKTDSHKYNDTIQFLPIVDEDTKKVIGIKIVGGCEGESNGIFNAISIINSILNDTIQKDKEEKIKL